MSSRKLAESHSVAFKSFKTLILELGGKSPDAVSFATLLRQLKDDPYIQIRHSHIFALDWAMRKVEYVRVCLFSFWYQV